MVSLQDEVEKLTQQLQECRAELTNARLQEIQPPKDYDSQLMQKLLDASSQIIHAKDEVRSLDVQNRLLLEERARHEAALGVSHLEAEEARQKAEDAEARLAAIARELAQLKSANEDLQARLEKEVKVYERSTRNKDKIIAELEERVTALEKENERFLVSEKENIPG